MFLMIGELNRQNPYVIQIIESMEPLKHKTLSTSVTFTRSMILILLVNIAGCILTWSLRYIPFFILIFISVSMVSIMSFRRVMKINPIAEITRVIYGNQYEKIYVNNEVLLNIIEDIAYFRGMLEILDSLYKYLLYGTLIISIGICIYRWILFFFI